MMTTARCCRFHEPCVPATVKQLIACRTQHHPDLRLDEIAERAGIRRDRLYAYGNSNAPDYPPADRFLSLCEVVGWDLLDFALRQFHRTTLALPKANAQRDAFVEAVDVSIAAADALRVVRGALHDGLCREDGLRILSTLDILDREIADLRAAVLPAALRSIR